MNGLCKVVKVEDGGASVRESEHDNADTHPITVTANVDPNSLRRLYLATTLKELFPRRGSSYELLEWLRDDFRGGTESELEMEPEFHTEQFMWRQKYKEAIGCDSDRWNEWMT